ncbi:MAG: hypothetical protein A4E25_00460 [Methanobacterium sp. PtaB.Bin024]|jgi:hypothetical protein|nr:MAG: hypothetical protein A4E25_00460 [Methanobacterium sp. PtaB.Bin024]
MKNKQKLVLGVVAAIVLVGLVGVFSFSEPEISASNDSNQTNQSIWGILSGNQESSASQGSGSSNQESGSNTGNGNDNETSNQGSSDGVKSADKIVCSACNGRGTVNYYDCVYCGNHDITTDQEMTATPPKCTKCGRYHYIFVRNAVCEQCGGTGWVEL